MTNSIRTSRSGPVPFWPTAKPEHILRDQDSSFRTVWNFENTGYAANSGNIDYEPIHILDQAFFLPDRNSLSLYPTSRAKWVLLAVFRNVELSPQSFIHNRQIVAEKVAQKHGMQMQQATQKAVETALSEISFTGYTKTEGGLEKALYRIIKMVVTNMVEKRTLN